MGSCLISPVPTRHINLVLYFQLPGVCYLYKIIGTGKVVLDDDVLLGFGAV
jgi:hypothetical protein